MRDDRVGCKGDVKEMVDGDAFEMGPKSHSANG